MASTVTLKRRINSIKNTKQITKAMELVSASKMRQAQETAKLSRDYSKAANELLMTLSKVNEIKSHSFFTNRKVKQKLYIVISSNSGLAGSYNYNVIKLLSGSIIKDRDLGLKPKVICIGKQGSNVISRLKGVDLLAVYNSFGDKPTANDIKPILNTVIDMYRSQEIDSVSIVYTLFVSNLVQNAVLENILPIKPLDSTSAQIFTNFEPSPETVLDYAVVRLIDAIIWQSILESLASEHSMRMFAMRNATDNATDLISEYTLKFNTARQSGITQELAEITGGSEALNTNS
ncbi:MAG TPA: ATP synthase F1 subunit gamma [Candidatus Saccharimonadia bacterium]|nr:ATP synthase F1 subunit gamma [Candidatus Saccharimonadia bacterium]